MIADQKIKYLKNPASKGRGLRSLYVFNEDLLNSRDKNPYPSLDREEGMLRITVFSFNYTVMILYISKDAPESN